MTQCVAQRANIANLLNFRKFKTTNIIWLKFFGSKTSSYASAQCSSWSRYKLWNNPLIGETQDLPRSCSYGHTEPQHYARHWSRDCLFDRRTNTRKAGFPMLGSRLGAVGAFLGSIRGTDYRYHLCLALIIVYTSLLKVSVMYNEKLFIRTHATGLVWQKQSAGTRTVFWLFKLFLTEFNNIFIEKDSILFLEGWRGLVFWCRCWGDWGGGMVFIQLTKDVSLALHICYAMLVKIAFTLRLNGTGPQNHKPLRLIDWFSGNCNIFVCIIMRNIKEKIF